MIVTTAGAQADEIRDPVTIPAPPPSGSYVVGPARLGRDESDPRAEAGDEPAAPADSPRDTDPAPPPCDPDD
jgi:hypothetical protein